MAKTPNEKDVQKLQKEVADLKSDVRFMKGFLLKLNQTEEQGKEAIEMQKIEDQLNGI